MPSTCVPFSWSPAPKHAHLLPSVAFLREGLQHKKETMLACADTEEELLPYNWLAHHSKPANVR